VQWSLSADDRPISLPPGLEKPHPGPDINIDPVAI
jgi:hypothetical protein